MKVITGYIFGLGTVSVTTGVTIEERTQEKFPVIELGIFADLEKRTPGQDVTKQKPESESITRLVFLNLESLEVLQKAINLCRDELEKKSELEEPEEECPECGAPLVPKMSGIKCSKCNYFDCF